MHVNQKAADSKSPTIILDHHSPSKIWREILKVLAFILQQLKWDKTPLVLACGSVLSSPQNCLLSLFILRENLSHYELGSGRVYKPDTRCQSGDLCQNHIHTFKAVTGWLVWKELWLIRGFKHRSKRWRWRTFSRLNQEHRGHHGQQWANNLFCSKSTKNVWIDLVKAERLIFYVSQSDKEQALKYVTLKSIPIPFKRELTSII